MLPLSRTPIALAPCTLVVLALPTVTLPLTAPARRPTLLSPSTLILPVVAREPVRLLSTAMPADWLPSIVIVPALAMFPTYVPPDST